MTSSSPSRRMPRTPVEVRDWNSRTSVDRKRIALPLRVASRTSSSSVSSDTPISRSVVSPCSSSLSSLSVRPKRIAILPAVGMLVKAAMLLRRTVPLAVANMMCSPPQVLLVLGQRQHGRDDFALGQRQQVDHRPALGGRAAFGQAPHLHAIDPAEVGEEQHRIVGRGDEQVGDRILVLGRHAGAALAAALLLAEHRQAACA